MKKRWKILILILLLWLFFNSLLGVILGTVGKCRVNYDRVNKAIFYTKCGGLTKSFMENVLGRPAAFTLGITILTEYSGLPKDIYLHELQHVKQYWILGPLFLPSYGVAHFTSWVDSKISHYKNIHGGNVFEIWADKWAGLPAEDKMFF